MQCRYSNNLIRQATQIQRYSELNDFNFHITIKLKPEYSKELGAVKKEITRIFKKLDRQISKHKIKINKPDEKIKAFSIYELNTDLENYHCHILFYYPYNEKAIEKTVNEINKRTNKKIDEIINNNQAVLRSINKLKTAIGKYSNGQIAVNSENRADIDIKPIYNQKEITRYLCKTCNEKIFNYFQLFKHKYSGVAYSDYIQALPNRVSLYSQINCAIPHKNIITQPAPAVKKKVNKQSVKRGNAKTTQIQAILEGVKIGNIVSYPNPIERRTANVRPLRTHSVIREPFQPKETTRKTALTRSRTARTGFTGHSLYNNKPPPHTRAYRAFTAHI